MGDSNRIQWGKVLLGMGTAMMAVVCLLAAIRGGRETVHSAAPPPVRVVSVAPTPTAANDAGVWCTTAAIEQADVHHRGPFGTRMSAVMGFLNLSEGLEVQHEPIGWRVTRSEGDLCGVAFEYRAGSLLKRAVFALLRRPSLHLVPVNAEASDITDMFDLWCLGVQLNEQHRHAPRHDQRLELAAELRGSRSDMQAIDVYVDHPDSSALVVEADHCAQPTSELPRSLATRMTSAGFATLVCRDETHDVARALPTSRHRHR